MKYFKLVAVFVIIVAIFSACTVNNKDSSSIACSKDEEEFVKTTYSNSELKNIVDFEGTMKELSEIYPIEYSDFNINSTSVFYFSDERVAVLIFDTSRVKILGRLYDLSKYKSDFEVLKPGDSLERVKEIDPNADCLFLYTGRSDFPRISNHFTKDGYIVIIHYDDSLIVKSIEYKSLK